MTVELAKQFDAATAQDQWLAHWAEKGYFTADPTAPGEAFTIVIPPPNVTGALHMGHALNNTLQDVLIRRARMQGKNALWVPGTDHAGIATQAIVEKLVIPKGQTRREFGREALIAEIWKWKDKYEARILGQLRALGSSCDWTRTRFTLDDGCSRAVRETFFKMFKDGYIYRGKRLVNWDTQLQTSVADDETYTETVKGGFWTFKYPIVDLVDTFIQFSTTRPETMLGDTALCVHPSDERYHLYHGMKVLQPHTGRKIPIIADGLLADPELGTGCVKVTPAHDPNDYACWTRNRAAFAGQPADGLLNILNPDGTINAVGGEKYAGLDRIKAREAVTAAMEELGLFVDKQDRDIPLPYSDRSKTPIEPYLSDQWFVSMGDRADGKPSLAQLASDAVTDGRVTFFPDRYAKTYQDWLGEKRDWCISRQLWWGHRIPVWYFEWKGPFSDVTSDSQNVKLDLDYLSTEQQQYVTPQVLPGRLGNKILIGFCVAPGHPDIEAALEAHGGEQDADVLDTWFSSALWPQSVLGWPDETADLKRYYPTSTLVTSRDIITLWVARMVLMGLYNLGEVPFKHVYITPKVLDGFGEGMSKSKGNGVDPLDVIALSGTDALRFYVTSIAGDTQDSRLPVSNVCPHCGTLVPVKAEHLSMRTKKLACPSCKKPFRPGGPWPTDDAELPTAKQTSDRFELGRNFANKLWNATRFLLMNLDGYEPTTVDAATAPVEDRWILSRFTTTVADVNKALDAYRFAEAARLIYEFTWSEFCDWYIEMSKSRRTDAGCRAVLLTVLDGVLRLIHPIMPFVSESLWHALNEAVPQRGLPTPGPCAESVCIAPWPEPNPTWLDARTETDIARLQELVRGIREVRNRYQIEPKAKLELLLSSKGTVSESLKTLRSFIVDLGGLSAFTIAPSITKSKQSAGILHADFEARIPLVGLIDSAVETKRIEKQLVDLKKQIDGMAGKLANESYVKNAPVEVVADTRQKVAELSKQVETLQENLQDLA